MESLVGVACTTINYFTGIFGLKELRYEDGSLKAKPRRSKKSREALESIRSHVLEGERRALQALRERDNSPPPAPPPPKLNLGPPPVLHFAPPPSLVAVTSLPAPEVVSQPSRNVMPPPPRLDAVNPQPSCNSVPPPPAVEVLSQSSRNPSPSPSVDSVTPSSCHNYILPSQPLDVAPPPSTVYVPPSQPVYVSPPPSPDNGFITAYTENERGLQYTNEQNTERDTSAKAGGTMAEFNRRAKRHEDKQMLAAKKRIAEHRAQRAQKVRKTSRSPRRRVSPKPSTTKPFYSSPAVSNLAHDISFYENQTFEESRKYVQERLTNVLGPERMNFQLLPSGHNPIDSPIAEYYREMATTEILEQWEQHKAEMRRQAEEQQRRAREEEAERFRILTLLDHYREKYVNRLRRIALYGPYLSKGIDFIEAALLAGDLQQATSVVQDLTHQVLYPIYELLKECEKEIPLEEVGADELKSVLPLERLEGMYRCLEGELDYWPEAVEMVQGIEALGAIIGNPTPFQHPLAPRQTTVDNSYSGVPLTENVPATNNLPFKGPSSGFSQPLFATAQAVNDEQQGEPVPEGNGYSKLLAATAEKFKASQEEASNAAPDIPSNNNAPPQNTHRGDILLHIAIDDMNFESEVQEMINRKAVVGSHRRKAAKCLQELLDLAEGETGILGDMDAGSFRSSIEQCVTKINELPLSQRVNKETRALRKLCGDALKLWSAHAD